MGEFAANYSEISSDKPNTQTGSIFHYELAHNTHSDRSSDKKSLEDWAQATQRGAFFTPDSAIGNARIAEQIIIGVAKQVVEHPLETGKEVAVGAAAGLVAGAVITYMGLGTVATAGIAGAATIGYGAYIGVRIAISEGRISAVPEHIKSSYVEITNTINSTVSALHTVYENTADVSKLANAKAKVQQAGADSVPIMVGLGGGIGAGMAAGKVIGTISILDGEAAPSAVGIPDITVPAVTITDRISIPSLAIRQIDGQMMTTRGNLRLPANHPDAKLYEEVAPSLVRLTCKGFQCTGYAVDNRGNDTMIATANHLFKFAKDVGPEQIVDVQVQLPDGRMIPGRSFAVDPHSDTAIVQAIGVQLKPLELDNDKWPMFTPVRVFGYPGTDGKLYMSRGEYLHNWQEDGAKMINSTAPSSPGVSGGAVISPSGKVVYTVTDGALDGNFGASVCHVRKLLGMAN